jgi:NADPH:quinone reductase-like Zn-dependent oxidoreductase
VVRAFSESGTELVRDDVADAEPGPGQVSVRMTAWSINYRDVLMARGSYDPKLPLPYVPLSDGVGEVIAIGEDVTRARPGDRVCPIFSPTWLDGAPDEDAIRKTRGSRVPGVLAERILLGEQELVVIPPYLSDVEAATLPCAGVTAWSALVSHGPVMAGEVVLVIGSGGVSTFAVQVSRILGARVVAVTSTAAKAERLRALGAEHTVSYLEDPHWGRTLRKWSDGGVDRVIEVGGAGTLEQSLDAVRIGGTIAVIGNVAGSKTELSVLPILMRQIRCQGVFVGHRRGFEQLCRVFRAHEVHPVIDSVFAWDEAPAAFARLASGEHVGKVCIRR